MKSKHLPISKEIHRITIRYLNFEIGLHNRHSNFYAPATSSKGTRNKENKEKTKKQTHIRCTLHPPPKPFYINLYTLIYICWFILVFLRLHVCETGCVFVCVPVLVHVCISLWVHACVFCGWICLISFLPMFYSKEKCNHVFIKG